MEQNEIIKTEEQKFIFKNIEFILAKPNLKIQRLATLLANKYDNFENEIISKEVKKDFINIIIKDKKLGEAIQSKELEQLNQKALESDNFYELLKYSNLKTQAQELFICEEENAKDLMSIMFTNHLDMIYDFENEDDINLYIEFMKSVLNAFFLKFRKSLSI